MIGFEKCRNSNLSSIYRPQVVTAAAVGGGRNKSRFRGILQASVSFGKRRQSLAGLAGRWEPAAVCELQKSIVLC